MPNAHHRWLCPLVAFLLARAQPALAQARLDSASIQALADSIFNSALASKHITAGAFVIVDGDRVLIKRGYGFTDPALTHPVSPDSTVFSAASVSKIVAATALMQLADRGLLSLRAPIAPILTRIPLRGVLAGDVTAEHLLTHTAGLDARFLGALAPPGTAQPRLEDYFRDTPPTVVRQPGSEVAYSNVGAALQGAVVEAITDEPFYEYVERSIFVPLGMTLSSFRQPLPKAIAAHRSTAGRRTAPFFRPYPAASLVTSAADMGRFMIPLLNRGRSGDSALFSERALGDMLSPHWRAQPTVPGVALGFFESFGPGGRALFHTGDGGDHSLLYLVPERHFGFYAVFNAGDEQGSQLREVLVTTLVARSLGAAAPAPMPAPPRDFAARAHEYEGTYRTNAYSHFNLEKIAALPMQLSVESDGKGSLLARQLAGGGNARLVEIAHDAFRTSDGGYAAFRRDGSGRVSSIVFSGSIWDPSTADRISWYQHAQLQLVAVLLAGLTFIARLIVGGARRIGRHRDVSRSTSPWRLTGIQSWLFVAAPLVAPLALFSSRPPYYTPPWSIYGCLIVLLLACALGPVSLGVAWRDRRARAGTRVERMLAWSVGVASLVVAAFLWSWNLLGVRL